MLAVHDEKDMTKIMMTKVIMTNMVMTMNMTKMMTTKVMILSDLKRAGPST